MENIQTSAVEEETQHAAERKQGRPPSKKKRKKTEPSTEYYVEETPYEKYSKELNNGQAGARTKRAIRQKEKDRNTCSLFIQTDPLIWRHISEQVGRINVNAFSLQKQKYTYEEKAFSCCWKAREVGGFVWRIMNILQLKNAE